MTPGIWGRRTAWLSTPGRPAAAQIQSCQASMPADCRRLKAMQHGKRSFGPCRILLRKSFAFGSKKGLIVMQGCVSRCGVGLLFAFIWAAAGCEEAPPVKEAAEAPPAAVEPEPQSALPTVTRGRIQFVEGFRPGSEQAMRDGKPMLVFFTAGWCNYCHQMEREAFTQEQVAELSERFLCILVDADHEADVCKQFQIR